MYRLLRPFMLVLTSLCMVAPSHAASPEVRATLLTTTGPDHISSGYNTAQTMSRLRDVGLNTVYVETWKNGYTQFPSQTLENLIGYDRSPFLGTRDLVAETLLEAHRNELNYIGWFEYGLASQYIGSGGTPSNPISQYMMSNGWLLQDKNGNYANASNGFAWMNPAVPEVRQFLVDMTVEMVEHYDLDGVMHDDRLAWPKDFGWDQTTKDTYFQETGNVLSNNPSTYQLNLFNNWRQDKVQLLAQELYDGVKAVRPDIVFSVSPAVTPWATSNYMADWPGWVDAGIFDEYAPQVYRDNYNSYLNEMPNQIAAMQPDEMDKLVPALRSVGSGNATPYADLELMIEHTRSIGAAGHAIWYSQGVLDLYESELTSFYDVANQGHAESPMFESGHRPAPLSGSYLGAGVWEFDVPSTAGYQVIGKVTGGEWESIDSFIMPEGLNQLFLPGYIVVEVLVDHRPDLQIKGDLDGDGFVGLNDLDIILNNWNQTIPPGNPLADPSGDGYVGLKDLDIVLNNWNAGTPPAGSATVPEPMSLLVFTLCAVSQITTRRR